MMGASTRTQLAILLLCAMASPGRPAEGATLRASCTLAGAPPPCPEHQIRQFLPLPFFLRTGKRVILGVRTSIQSLLVNAEGAPTRFWFDLDKRHDRAISRHGATLALADGDQLRIKAGGRVAGSIRLHADTLGTHVDASGHVVLHPPKGRRASIVSIASSPSGSPSMIGQYAVTRTKDGRLMIMLMTNGQDREAFSIGAMADRNGFRLIGIGDLGGTNVRTTNVRTANTKSNRLVMHDAFTTDSGWVLAPGLGPVLETSGLTTRHKTLFVVDPAANGSLHFPKIGMVQTKHLRSRSRGAAFELDATRALAPDFELSIGTSLDIADTLATYHRKTTILIPGTPRFDISKLADATHGLTSTLGVNATIRYHPRAGETIWLSGGADFRFGIPDPDITHSGRNVHLGQRAEQQFSIAIGYQIRF